MKVCDFSNNELQISKGIVVDPSHACTSKIVFYARFLEEYMIEKFLYYCLLKWFKWYSDAMDIQENQDQIFIRI